MKVYQYDACTREYTGINEAFLDKMATRRNGKDTWCMPAYTTTIKPPKVKKGEVATFNIEKERWETFKDFRGLIIYNLATRESMICEQIGDLPKGYALELPERLEDVQDTYLKVMKTNFDVCLTNTKVPVPVQDLYFSYKSLDRLKNEQSTGIMMSRDDNNKIYMLTRQEYDVIINYLVVYGQYMYLKKWTIENIIKKCTDLEILKTHKKELDFKVDIKQINNLYKLTPEARKEYFVRTANNIK